MISEQSLKRFKELWKKNFNEELDDATASDRASDLLNLFRAVYGEIILKEKDDGR